MKKLNCSSQILRLIKDDLYCELKKSHRGPNFCRKYSFVEVLNSGQYQALQRRVVSLAVGPVLFGWMGLAGTGFDPQPRSMATATRCSYHSATLPGQHEYCLGSKFEMTSILLFVFLLEDPLKQKLISIDLKCFSYSCKRSSA